MPPQQISWSGWEIGNKIGKGGFGSVYEIYRNMFGETERAALKVISIPQTQSEVDELRLTGYDDASIVARYQDQLKTIVQEYSLMSKLKGNSNVVNCDDVRYVPHDNGIGWTIYIKMELLTPLMQRLDTIYSEAQIVKLGQDLSRALVLCRQKNIIHRDIKPQNIFISDNGDYKLGDFGIAKVLEHTSGGTRIGTVSFMVPEVFNGQPYGHSSDIYSLGLVLYWLLNEKRMPFLPLPPELPTSKLEEESLLRRFRGEQIPAPVHGSRELKKIVLKACAFDPKQRYSSALEMLEDLNRLKPATAVFSPVVPEAVKRNTLTNVEGTTSLNAPETTFLAEPAGQITQEIDQNVPSNIELETRKPSAPKKWVFALLIATSLVLTLVLFLHSCNSKPGSPTTNSMSGFENTASSDQPTENPEPGSNTQSTDSEQQESKNPQITDPVQPETSRPQNPDELQQQEPEDTQPTDPSATKPTQPSTTKPTQPFATEPATPPATNPETFGLKINGRTSTYGDDYHAEITIAPDEEIQLSIVGSAGTVAAVQWSMSKSNIVAISEKTVTGLSNGTVTLSATYASKQYTCKVVVKGSAGSENTRPTTPAEIMAAAQCLEQNKELPYEVTLSGKVTRLENYYDLEYKHISFTITVDGTGGKTLFCYRMKGSEAANIGVNDTVTVVGTLKNYNGKLEMLGKITKRVSGSESMPSNPKEIVDAAYELSPGARLPYSVILTGKIVSIDREYEPAYKNITVTIAVAGKENKPIQCYRLKGNDAETLAVGDIITVTGIIENYQNSSGGYKIQFVSGCKLV